MESDFVQQVAHAARGPEARDEFMVVRRTRELHFIGELAWHVVKGAIRYGGRIALTGVTTQEHESVAAKQIRQRRGIELRHAHVAGEFERRIRQHRVFDLGEERRDLHFEVFLGQHVLAEGARVLGNPVEQMGVHIGADAEAEDAGAVFVQARDILDDLFLVRRADGGPTVREENHDKRSPALGRDALPRVLADPQVGPTIAQRERFLERLVNRRAADGFQFLDKLIRLVAVRFCRRHQLVEQRFDFGRKTDDLEAVAAVQIRDAELERLFGLIQLLAGHRTRSIEDESHVLGDDLLVFRLHARRNQ